jgi:hypothetical protein
MAKPLLAGTNRTIAATRTHQAFGAIFGISFLIWPLATYLLTYSFPRLVKKTTPIRGFAAPGAPRERTP